MTEQHKIHLPGGLNLWHLILLGVMVVQAVLGINSRDNMMVAFKTHAEDFEKEVKKELAELKASQVQLSEKSGSLDVVNNELIHIREDILNLAKKVDLLVERRR